MRSLSRLAFQQKCSEILSAIYPELHVASESGELDAAGIDLFTYDLKGEEIEFAFQCKGFESPKFDSSHLAQCLKSIEAFATSKQAVFSYFLVLNKQIIDQSLREKLLGAIKALKESGKAEYAEVLDLDGFVNFVFEQIDIELRDRILEANKRFKEEYQIRMEQRFYQQDVPFMVYHQPKKIRNNPGRYIRDTAIGKYLPQRMGELEYSLGKTPKDSQKKIWKFAVSEFGYGKTSLLHNLFSDIDQERVLPLYLPIAQFDQYSFVNGFNACKNILEIILQRKTDEQDVRDRLLIKALNLMMRRRQDLVLMFDGLDEHHYAYQEEGLRSIFNCFRDFQPICIFTMRKEFWYERQGNFEKAVGTRFKASDLIMLTEWDQSHIGEFLRRFQEEATSKKARESIGQLIEVVQKNQYQQYYGDIPKRPLFLKMLAEDVIEGNIEKRNLAQIYENYLVQKFDLDRATSVSRKLSGRPLSIKGDRHKIIPKIFTILEQAAARMMYNDPDGKIVLLNDIRESILESIMQSLQVSIGDIAELLLNSVLIPIDKRSLEDFRIKFAHRSFQEFFTARYLLNLLLNPGGSRQDYDWFQYIFPAEIEKFLMGMLESIAEDSSQYRQCKTLVEGIYQEHSGVDSVVRKLAAFFNIPGISKTAETKSRAGLSPQVFISYSHDSEAHKKWVLRFVKELRKNGIYAYNDTLLSANRTINFNQMMIDGFTEYDYIIVVLTENYKLKAESKRGGVYSECILMSEDILKGKYDKYIFVLRSGDYETSFPRFLKGISSFDMRKEQFSTYTEAFREILGRILGIKLDKDDIGKQRQGEGD